MNSYLVTESAQDDLEDIYAYILQRDGAARADYVLDTIYATFDDLVRLPAMGHRRVDVDRDGLLFYAVFRFEIAFSREPHVIIRRVVHGARDIPRRL